MLRPINRYYFKNKYYYYEKNIFCSKVKSDKL
jgi:hypothetical protein